MRYQEAHGPLTQSAIAVVFVALLLSALVTETIGIHALSGAFFLGALIPHDSALARQVRERLEDLVLVFLLPAFFAFTGLRTEIGLVESAADWTACIVIILLASAGKFGGSYVAASIGILMNTRGRMELIVLNVGLDLGILSPTLFAMLVMMALVTTFTATPVLQWLDRTGPATGK